MIIMVIILDVRILRIFTELSLKSVDSNQLSGLYSNAAANGVARMRLHKPEFRSLIRIIYKDVIFALEGQ